MFSHLISRALLLAAAIIGLLPLAGVAQGLQMTLTTSGTAFTVVDQPTTGAPLVARRAWQTQRVSIVAAATLTNFSNNDVTLFYDHAGAAVNRFQFQALNSAGVGVWTSEWYPDVAGTPAGDQAILKRRSSLRRTVQIPLRSGNSWLPTGRYTLVASTGTGGPQASAIFDIVSPVPATDTGITGTVRVDNAGADPSPIRATVYIEEVRPANARFATPRFTWSGTTDAQGVFRVVTPPGKFNVSAWNFASFPGAGPILSPITLSIGGILPIFPTEYVIVAPNSSIVQVAPGKFTTCDFTLTNPVRAIRNFIPVVTSAKLINFWTTNAIPPTVGFQLQAVGTVPTGSYRNPRLVLRPADPVHPEIRAYDFLIDPPAPGSAVTLAFESHTATVSISVREPEVYPTTVRVYAGGNSLDATISLTEN